MKTFKAFMLTITGQTCLVLYGKFIDNWYSLPILAIGVALISVPAFNFWETKVK